MAGYVLSVPQIRAIFKTRKMEQNENKMATDTNEQLNALKERAYKTAVEHGFHEEEKSDAYWLGLVMSEMGEAINADRKGLHADTKGFEDGLAKFPPMDCFNAYIKDTVEDEIADIVIRLLDFAGLKKYAPFIISSDLNFSNHVLQEFENCKLPGVLFNLIGSLYDASDANILEECIGLVIVVLSDCFKTMTGSDKDLWWFVERKMKYNELRPKLNGKKY